jgi:hypothetical protein
MILPRLIIWPSMLWLVLWLILMGNTPVDASGNVNPQAYTVLESRRPDLGILKETASIAGACSIVTAIIWASGLVAAARYKFLGRRNGQCGEP